MKHRAEGSDCEAIGSSVEEIPSFGRAAAQPTASTSRPPVTALLLSEINHDSFQLTDDCTLSGHRLHRDERSAQPVRRTGEHCSRVEGGADLKAPLARSPDGMSAEGAATSVPSNAEGSTSQHR